MLFIHSNFTLKDYKNYDAESRKVLLFEDSDCDTLLEKFYSDVIKAIDKKKHFPIIRIADGELQFLLGKNEFNVRKPILVLLRNLLGELLRKLSGKNFEARSRTYTSGVYSRSERAQVRASYAECFKHVAKSGILALYTIIKPGFYTEQYLPKLFDFFKTNGILLDSSNYIPFYFVYIILTNKRYSKIYQNKSVHLITSFNNARKRSIEKSLFSQGVRSISWTNISKDKSLFDVIDIDSIDKSADLVFVGAGVGKVNIFNQLKKFSAVVIDAGYIFEIWQNPELEAERDYCRANAP